MKQKPTEKQIRDTYDLARERYALLGVDPAPRSPDWRGSPAMN